MQHYNSLNLNRFIFTIVTRKRDSPKTDVSELIIFFNVIYSSSQASGPAQRKKKQQRERLQRKNRVKKFYKLLYLEKSCISLETFHFNLAVMPGGNCAFVGCSSNRHHKKISLFKLPAAKEMKQGRSGEGNAECHNERQGGRCKFQEADRERNIFGNVICTYVSRILARYLPDLAKQLSSYHASIRLMHYLP